LVDKLRGWVFRYDEAKAEITATRGPEIRVYRLNEMGESGKLMREAMKGSHGATWSVPSYPDPHSYSPYSAAVCQAAAVLAVSFGCAAIGASCAATSVITVGALIIPCALLVPLACGIGAGGGAIVSQYCPPR
jgi:hypothetical protein